MFGNALNAGGGFGAPTTQKGPENTPEVDKAIRELQLAYGTTPQPPAQPGAPAPPVVYDDQYQFQVRVVAPLPVVGARPDVRRVSFVAR